MTMLTAELLALHVGRVQTFGADDYSMKPWTTGFYKSPVAGSLSLNHPSEDGTIAALAGDGQADLKYHGGPEKAVCVYAAEHYAFWRDELNVNPFAYGAFGENFTLSGLTERDICIGDIFEVGEGPSAARVQVSQPRQPCWKLARRWNIKDLALRVQETGKTGWYFRVLHEGDVKAGQTLRLVASPHPQWPLSLANEIMHHCKDDLEAATELAACPALSVSWKKTLGERAQRVNQLDTSNRLKGID